MVNKDSNTPKALKAVVGAAHHALRAYVKAFETRSESGERFRYHVPQDGQSAAILDASGQIVMERAIHDWAREGPPVRLCLIGLRCLQDEIHHAARVADSPASVRFVLDILDGRAWLELDAQKVSKGDLDEFLPLLKLSDRARALIPTMAPDDLQTVAGWARIGRQVEIDFFQSLQAAESYGIAESVEELRIKGESLRIIRPRKPAPAVAVTDGAE